MALSNVQLVNIFKNSLTHPHYILKDNNARIQRANKNGGEKHAIGFYFGDESVSKLKNPNKDPFHIYIISPNKETRIDDCSLAIFPFNLRKITSLIEEIGGINEGHIQLNSNFNAFKIHNINASDNFSGVGYSVRIDNEESLWRLLVEIKKRLMLESGDTRRLPSLHQKGLPKSGKDNETGQTLSEFLANSLS